MLLTINEPVSSGGSTSLFAPLVIFLVTVLVGLGLFGDAVSATGRFGDRQFGDGTVRRQDVSATDFSATRTFWRWIFRR